MQLASRYLCITAALLAVSLPTFGSAVRDPTGSAANTLPANDDGSTSAVPLGFSIDFFGQTFSNVYVNNNGNLTFTQSLSQFTPTGLSGVGLPIIAPFFADVDTRGSGSGLVTYGTGTITDPAEGWNNDPFFAIEWPSVGFYFENTTKTNTFEALLVDRADTGTGNFDIEFNYNNVLWETGDASGGTNGLGGTSAAVGYSNGLSGAQNVTFQLPGSLVNGALINGGPDALVTHDLNSSVAGRYDFTVRGGNVVTSTMPEPGDLLLLASGLAFIAFSQWRRRA